MRVRKATSGRITFPKRRLWSQQECMAEMFYQKLTLNGKRTRFKEQGKKNAVR
jgi:hypothetical protein